MQKFKARNAIGGVELYIYPTDGSDVIVPTPHSSVTIHIPDEDASQIAQTLLERLAGQGKVDEKLRVMCVQVGGLPRGR